MIIDEVKKELTKEGSAIDTIILVGIETHVCVEATVQDLLSLTPPLSSDVPGLFDFANF